MIIWKAIIATAQPYRVMRKVIVKTDIKEIHERREQGIEVDFCQNFLLGGKYTTFIIFVFKCTFWQMTRKYLTGLIFVLFMEPELQVLFVWCHQLPAFVWTDDSFSRELHLELWWIEWAVKHKQKPYPPKRRSKIWFDSEELEDAGPVGGATLREAMDQGGTNKGACLGLHGKKDEAIEREWCSRHPWSLVLGACDPWRFTEL